MTINPSNHTILDNFTFDLNTLVKINKMRKSTAIAYISDVTQFLNYIGEKPATEITHREIESFFDNLKGCKEQSITSSTRNRKVMSLKHFYRFIYQEEKLMEYNPMDRVKMAEILKGDKLDRKDKVEMAFLEKQEINKFISYLKSQVENPTYDPPVTEEIAQINALRDLAMYHLMINTGLRVGEVISLELDQLEALEDRMEVYISPIKSKNKRSRVIPCSLEVLDEIDEYRKAIPYNDTHVFLSHKGNILDRSTINRKLKSYMELLKIKKRVNNHTLRHTYATHNAGAIGIVELAKRLGHSDIQITIDNYYHSNEESKSTMVNF